MSSVIPDAFGFVYRGYEALAFFLEFAEEIELARLYLASGKSFEWTTLQFIREYNDNAMAIVQAAQMLLGEPAHEA